MGVGDHVFEHFGHAAICVGARCYNYGTADFSTPVPLTWNFIRGRAMFWVAVADRDKMIGWYRRSDRSVWKQTLPLTSSQAIDLAAALERGTSESEKYYRYHHFLDNCTTRIRDQIDLVVGHQLSKRTGIEKSGPTFREYARAGFAGDVPLLLAAELILGRAADLPTSDWEGMFLPDVFRRELEENLGAKSELVYRRVEPPPHGETWLGRIFLLAVGIILGVLILVSHRVGPVTYRTVLSISGLVLGLFGAVLWSLAILSAFEELRMNEVLLVLVPFDVAFGFLPVHWRRKYVAVRVIGSLVVLFASITGLFVQPLIAPIAMVLIPLGFIAVLRTPPRETISNSATD
jgi:hypothetical protein